MMEIQVKRTKNYSMLEINSLNAPHLSELCWCYFASDSQNNNVYLNPRDCEVLYIKRENKCYVQLTPLRYLILQ